MATPVGGSTGLNAGLRCIMLILICTSCENEVEAPKTALNDMVITWSYRKAHHQGADAILADFAVNGARLAADLDIGDFVKANHFRYQQVKIQFPKGEPSGTNYSAPYLPLAKLCLDFHIPLAYVGSDGKRMTAHILTWVDYDGEVEPEKAQYVFDGVNLGLEENALSIILRQDIIPPNFIQVLCPWQHTPSGMQHYPPAGLREVEKHFEDKGVRVEYYEARVGFNENYRESK